jgi:hypothetical protein
MKNKDLLLALVRHSLTFIGGLLIMQGLVDESALQEVIGSAVSLTSAIWMIVEKNKTK